MILFQNFWDRWSKEYLATLQVYYKKGKNDVEVKVDDLVLIAEEGIRPLNWPRGRVVETFKGKDGKVRVCNIQTESGIFKRGIVKLVKLFDD